MNGHVKFHKANGPAFNAGEPWVSSCGNKVTIKSVRQFGPGKWDYEVHYSQEKGVDCKKDAWNFQVRYEHIADKKVRQKVL